MSTDRSPGPEPDTDTDTDTEASAPRSASRERSWRALVVVLVVVLVGNGLALLVARWLLGSDAGADRAFTVLAIGSAVMSTVSFAAVAVGFLLHPSPDPVPADRLEPMLAEIDADRWGLLGPPSRSRVRRRRALLLVMPVLLVATYAFSAFLEPEPGAAVSQWRWALVALGLTATAVGSVWGWRSADAPEVLVNEVERLRLRPATVRARRELLRRLRHGPRLEGAERGAVAALVATRHDDHFQAAFWLTYAGGFLVLAAPTAGDVLAWLPCTIFGVFALVYLAVDQHTRGLHRAADRAGLAAPITTAGPGT